MGKGVRDSPGGLVGLRGWSMLDGVELSHGGGGTQGDPGVWEQRWEGVVGSPWVGLLGPVGIMGARWARLGWG